VYFLTVSFGAFLASLCCCCGGGGGGGGGGDHHHHPIFIHLFHALFFSNKFGACPDRELWKRLGLSFLKNGGSVLI